MVYGCMSHNITTGAVLEQGRGKCKYSVLRGSPPSCIAPSLPNIHSQSRCKHLERGLIVGIKPNRLVQKIIK